MIGHLITPNNAILATRYLLELDINAVREQHQRDIYQWVANIKKAQKDYLGSLKSDYRNKEHTAENLQKSLTQLADCAKNMTCILSEEAKRNLADLLLMNEKI